MDFASRQITYRQKIRREMQAAFPELFQVRADIVSAIYSRLEHIQGETFPPDDQSMFLIAQYITGIEFSFAAIVEGLYPQAANLQKQEIETLAALEQVRKGKRREGQTPNVKNSLPEFALAYSNLNDLAHPSKSELVQAFNMYEDLGKSGPTVVPQLRKEVCRILLPNHCVYLIKCWDYMSVHFNKVAGVETPQEEMQKLHSTLMEFERAKRVP